MIAILAFLVLFFGISVVGKYWPIHLVALVILLIISITKYKKKGLILFAVTIIVPVIYAVSPFILSTNKSGFDCELGLVISAKKNYFLVYTNGERYYVSDKENKKEQGDIISISGSVRDLDIYTIESEFNFKEYLNNKGVYKQIDATKITTKFAVPIRKRAIINSFLNNFSNDTKGFISGLLFAEIDYSSDLIKNLALLNVLSAFSTSGIFMFMLFSFSELIIKKFVKKKTRVSLISILIFLPYLFFTFTKVSILRVYLLKIIKLISLKHKNLFRYGHLEQLSVVGIILLLLNHYFAFQSGFYIGFLVSFFVYILRKAFKVKGERKQKLVAPIYLYVALFPIMILSRNEFNILGIPYHYLFVFTNFVSLFLGLITFALPFLAFIYDAYIKVLTNVYNGLLIKNITIPISLNYPILLVLYYSLLLLIIYFKEIKKNKIKKIFMSTLLVELLFTLVPFEGFFISSINFINIGQGDACLIRDGTKNYMIDVGGNKYDDLALNSLIPYFNKLKIYKLDAVFISHYDYDHYGSLDSLKANFKVGQIYDLNSSFPVKIGNITFYNVNNRKYGSVNDNSVVLYFSFIGYKFLFTGDIATEVEENIIKDYKDLDIDILKVAHHGSIYSYSENFIKAISPKEAIISSGKNKYGHPDPKIIELLKKYNVKVRLTSKEGTISYNKFVFNVL